MPASRSDPAAKDQSLGFIVNQHVSRRAEPKGLAGDRLSIWDDGDVGDFPEKFGGWRLDPRHGFVFGVKREREKFSFRDK